MWEILVLLFFMDKNETKKHTNRMRIKRHPPCSRTDPSLPSAGTAPAHGRHSSRGPNNRKIRDYRIGSGNNRVSRHSYPFITHPIHTLWIRPSEATALNLFQLTAFETQSKFSRKKSSVVVLVGANNNFHNSKMDEKNHVSKLVYAPTYYR